MRSAALFALLVVASPLSAQRTSNTASAVKELNTLFEALIAALQAGDTAALERIYAPRYSFAIGGGDTVTVLSRQERLAAIAANDDSIPRLNVERCDFDIHGTTTAVGRCWVRQLGEGGQWTGIYTTAVFRRTGGVGRWQLIASHASVNRPLTRRAATGTP